MNSDLAQYQQWKEQIDNACSEANVEAGCLKLDVKVYENGEQGKLTLIPNPGDSYGEADNPKYSECLVGEMNPRSPSDGGPKKVPAGTTIRVKIVCTPTGSNETAPADQQPGKEKNTKDKTSTPGGPGG